MGGEYSTALRHPWQPQLPRPRHVVGDVGLQDLANRLVTGGVGAGPGDDLGEGVDPIIDGLPVETAGGFVPAEAELARLDLAGVRVSLHPAAAAPEIDQLVGNFRRRNPFLLRRPEVPGAAEGDFAGQQLAPELQVAAERHQDMLPGTDAMWVADEDGGVVHECFHAVWHQAVGGKVAAADDVAGPDGDDGHTVLGIAARWEISVAVGADGELRHRLGSAVGVGPTQPVPLAVTPDPFLIFIHLVGGDGDEGADSVGGADGFEEV